MNRVRTLLVAGAVLLGFVSAVAASSADIQRQEVRLARRVVGPQGAAGTSYSVEVPVVARVQGTAFFRTMIDINNNTTSGGVTADFQFSYTCVSAGCNPAGGFYRTTIYPNNQKARITLPAIGNFHSDDFVQYLSDNGFLVPGALEGSIGTLLVTFSSLPSSFGFEGTVVARTYNRIVEIDPSHGTVGFAYNSSLFFESSGTTLVGYARDTKSSPTLAGKLRSNVGIRNTDVNSTTQNVTVVVTTYDTVTGQRVGNALTLSNIIPGELRQISDLWNTASIASSVNSVIVFADNPNGTLNTATFEGYITIIDGQNTQDAAFFEMKCADPNNHCGGQ
jgi:hypothetical protein